MIRKVIFLWLHVVTGQYNRKKAMQQMEVEYTGVIQPELNINGRNCMCVLLLHLFMLFFEYLLAFYTHINASTL